MINYQTTLAVTEPERVDYWKSIVSNAFTSLDVAPLQPSTFNAHIKQAQLLDIAMAEVFSSGCRVSHGHAQIRQAAGAYFFLHLQLQGRSINQQCGREAVLNAGDITLCDSTRPYSIEFDQDNTMLVMRVPAATLATLVGSPEKLTCVAIKNAHGGSFMAGIISHIWHEMLTTDPSPQHKHTLERMVFDSLSIGLGTHPMLTPCGSSVQRSQRSRILSLIETHLTEPDLSPQRIADSLGISKRYLHALFRDQTESFSQYVLRRRLELATELLTKTPINGQTISQVAFAAGFNSLNSFGRVFRKTYGVTPKQFVADQCLIR